MPVPTAQAVEKMTVYFSVLSPIHIGTREGALQPMEYLYDGQQVHVVDESKLGRFLIQRNLMDAFVQQAFSGDLRRKGLHDFLRERVRDVDVKKIGPLVAAYSVPGGGADMSDFRPFVRDGFGNVYIPGTSIKGVLRTAFLYAVLKSQNPGGAGQSLHPKENQVRAWIRDLRDQGNKEWAKKFLSARLQKEMLQSWKIPGKAHDQNRDILRCLKVRDAYPVNGKVQTRVVPIRFLSKRSDGSHYWSQKPRGSGDLVVWVEAVTAGTFQTEILWDHELWKTFSQENPGKKSPAASAKGILLLADRMNRDLAAHEKAFFTQRGIPQGAFLKSWYEALGNSLFRIGFGSGMLSTTVNLLWSEKLRQEIRNVCGQDRGADPAPKSRRVWVKSDTECLPMGWARITIVAKAVTSQDIQKLTPEPEVQPPVPHPVEKPSPAVRSGERTPQGKPDAGAAPVLQGIPSGPSREKGRISKPTEKPPEKSTRSSPPPAPEDQERPGATGLVGKAKIVSLTDKIAMERLFQELEEADETVAREAAEVLKERMIKQNLWKKSPFRTSIEELLA